MDKKIDRKMSWPKGYEPKDDAADDLNLRLGLISSILKDKPKKKMNTEIFNVMATRRSTRNSQTIQLKCGKLIKYWQPLIPHQLLEIIRDLRFSM